MPVLSRRVLARQSAKPLEKLPTKYHSLMGQNYLIAKIPRSVYNIDPKSDYFLRRVGSKIKIRSPSFQDKPLLKLHKLLGGVKFLPLLIK
jgi:hypothetical protein